VFKIEESNLCKETRCVFTGTKLLKKKTSERKPKNMSIFTYDKNSNLT